MELAGLHLQGSPSEFIRWSLLNCHFYDADTENLAWEPDEDFLAASSMWGFVRLLKGHSRYSAAEPMDVMEQVGPLMKLGPTPDEFCPWSAFFGLDVDQAEVFFCATWEKVKRPAQPHPIAVACWKTRRYGTANLPGKHPRLFAPFITMIGWRQHAAGDGTITLPCKVVPLFLGGDPMTVSRLTDDAEEKGFLTRITPPNWRGGKAAEFRGVRIDDPRLQMDFEQSYWLLYSTD